MTPRRPIPLLVAALLILGVPLNADFLTRRVVVHHRAYRYVVYVPAGWTADKKWPVILFLHGAGERGTDGQKPVEVGIGSALRAMPQSIPAIVIFPQARKGECWLGRPAEAAMEALRSVVEEFGGDRERLYVTGLSLGGFGAWHLALAYPHTFAAIVPICGGIVPHGSATSVRQSPLTIGAADPYKFTAETLANVPVWMFHGETDDVILASESRKLRDAFVAAGAHVRYTEYQGRGHEIWDCAYEDENLWTWLFTQQLSNPATR